MPNGSFLRRGPACADTASPTCENRAPTRGRGLGAIEHGRDAFRRVVRRALARSPDPRECGFDTTDSRIAHPFATPPLLTRSASRRTEDRHLAIPVRERVTRRVRAFVTRSAGGPTPPCDAARSTNQRCVRPTSAQSLESIGHPDQCGSRALKKAGADGGSRRRCALRRSRFSLGTGVLIPPSRRGLEPPLTPLSRFERPRSHEENAIRSSSQGRLAAHRVNDT